MAPFESVSLSSLTDPTIAPTRGFPACQRQDYISNGLDCYKVHNAHKTYSQATAACKAEQAYLTSIMSIYEQAYIDTLIENIDSPVWTGLRDPGVRISMVTLMYLNPLPTLTTFDILEQKAF